MIHINGSPTKPIAKRCSSCQARADCLLVDLPLFSEFEKMSQSRPYNRGVTLYRQGDDVQNLYVLCSGWIKLFWVSGSGKRRLVRVAGPANLLGLVEIFSRHRYETTAEVIDSSTLTSVEKNRFLAFLNRNPRLAVKLLGVVSRETQHSQAVLCDISGKLSAANRLLHTLQEYAESCGQEAIEGTKLRIPLTVQDLSDGVGYSRQWTTKLLTDLAERGFVLRRNGWIILTPQAAQERIVD